MQEQLEQEFDIVSGAAGPEALSQITEQINQQRSLPSILRQLCLLSVSQTAVKPKDWVAVTAALYHSYGHKHMQTLADLEEAGLLLPHEGRTGNVARLRKRFKLVVADGRVDDGATLFGFKPVRKHTSSRLASSPTEPLLPLVFLTRVLSGPSLPPELSRLVILMPDVGRRDQRGDQQGRVGR